MTSIFPAGTAFPSGTVTFLFTDIEGSTPLWESQPKQMAEALQTHNTALRQAIESQGGIIFKTVGDAFQAAFPTASQALRAAIEGQKALRSVSWNDLGPLKVRMGLHTGEAEPDPAGDGYSVSHTLNRVARIMSAATGGQILLSQETKDLVDHQLPLGVTLKDLGEHRLKGMQWLEHLYQVSATGLPQDFPILATGITHPHNLPTQLTSFIGRERETADVVDLLEKHRLVTLTGSGGTGKTRLSLRVAEEVLNKFQNGVWFAELAGLGDPELVPRTLIAVLGLQESPNRSMLDQLTDHLRGKKVLILLDNCEHVISDCARTAEALLRTCPKLKILASSREALSVPGEIAYHVPSLSAPDPRQLPPLEEISHFNAVRLFVERAAAHNPGFAVTPANAQAISQVCHRLDGIPLAIELAAARVGPLSVEQIASRLDNRFRLLTGGSRTAVPRQQTLRASIDWSYSLLPESERLLLMRLSVFQGGWTLELVSEVCAFEGLDEYDVLDGLSQLVNKSLIYVVNRIDGTNRYRRLETIRQYGREKLLDSGNSEAVHDRHLDAFLRLAETAEPNLRSHHQVEWLDRLEEELDNLRAALEWALEGNAQKGLRLATSLYWFWHIRGYRIEGEKWLGLYQERSKTQPGVDPVLLVTARGRQIMLQCAIGQVGPSTASAAEEALIISKRLGEAGLRSQFLALHALAWNAGYLNQKPAAHQYFLQCQELAERLAEPFFIAEVAQNLSFFEREKKKSREYAERNLALRQELGDLDGLMTAQQLMAGFQMGSGNFAQARFMLEESILTARKVKNRMGMISGYGGLGRVYYLSGEIEKGLESFSQALAIAREQGEQIWIIWELNAIGLCYGAKKEKLMAEQYLNMAIETARESHFVFWEVICSFSLAETAWTLGEIEAAIHHYQVAADIGKEQPGISLEGVVAYSLGKANLLRKDAPLATRYFQQALKEFAERDFLDGMGPALESLAVCAVQMGQYRRAIRLRGAIAARNWISDPFWPLWLASYDLDSLLTTARTALGEAEYARFYTEGQSLSLEQSVALGLEANND